jgi:hypothetical protein
MRDSVKQVEPGEVAATLGPIISGEALFILVTATKSGLVTCLMNCPPGLAAELIETARQRLESQVQ